jgi:hypothetical protein
MLISVDGRLVDPEPSSDFPESGHRGESPLSGKARHFEIIGQSRITVTHS